MVDWSIARQVARLAAGSEPRPDLGVDLAVVCAELAGPVGEYTQLVPATPVPPPELLDRAQWATLNLTALEPLLDPVTGRLDGRLELAGPLAGILKTGAGAAIAAEAGLVLGYVARRVLGQYELSLLGADTPPRLVLVGVNLDSAARQLDVDRGAFLTWVCAHELTHVFQFQGVPWLRDHLGDLLRRYLDTVEVRVEGAGAGGLPSAAKHVETFREGGLAALVQTGEQKQLMSQVQATMAVVEGYSEHVMDVLGERLIPRHAELRAAMDRRRQNRSAPARLLERLLGFDLKLRQYELGKHFCDGVVEQAGIDALNRVWSDPAALPTLDELDEPARWIARTAPPRAA
jgi:coenzyme F420 biosynthesis associated uncharacterized protein